MSYFSHLDEIGSSSGRAYTDTLYVSPNGTATDGRTWVTAYTTIQAALDAASTDADDCTKIMNSPHTTFYDINTTGDPTWTGNYELVGSHRLWAPVRNSHVSATSIMKFSGKVGIKDLALFQTAAVDGIIFTGNGFRIRHCGFNSESITGAATSIHIDGSGGMTQGGIIEDIQVKGHSTRTTALYMNASRINEFRHMHIHDCLTGVQILGATSDYNTFHDCDIGDCAIGLDIDAGNEQHFDHIDFHHNTKNVDDEVGDSTWANIHGEFDISIEPDTWAGTGVSAGVDDVTWGADTELRAAASSPEKPFRIVGTQLEADDSEKFRLRLSADSGATFFDDIQIEGDANAVKREAAAADAATEHIFNKGTRISGSVKSQSGGNGMIVLVGNTGNIGV